MLVAHGHIHMQYHLKINLGYYGTASNETLKELMRRDDGRPECSPEAAAYFHIT